MFKRFGKQYERGGYLKSLARQRLNKALDPKRFASDKARLERIEKMEPEMRALDDREIQAKFAGWQDDVAGGEKRLDELIEPIFACVRECCRRTLHMFPYPEQILGGLAIARGAIAEMATGEGKTLTITLPAAAFALHKRGVHVITVNSYLAERDYEFAKPLFDFLGLTIGLVPEGADTSEKKHAYDQDVTYGVGYEYGFDYMRDQLTLMRHPKGDLGEELRYALLDKDPPIPETAQRGHAYAIIDEVDSVLIDEAGTPLLISEPSNDTGDVSQSYYRARNMAEELMQDIDYKVDETKRKIDLTARGMRLIHESASKIPWSLLRRPWTTYVLNALKAEHLFDKDVHYVVNDGAVVIVDEFTGRKFEDRSWREGLHQAVEAKEDLEIKPENDSAASISRQSYFQLYETISGLTGTAAESAGEFWNFFEMPVQEIPLHKPSQRKIYPERIFRSADAKYAAIVADLIERRKTGQPVLVGTRSIWASEAISALLEEEGVPHRLLTAKQDEEENEIVSGAGAPRCITIATNMAGRGTDIKLSPQSLEAGGLHVIQVERNESVRIDRQLIGRGARQGQPGSAQAYVSADDHIIKTFKQDVRKALRNARSDANGELPSSFSRVFDRVQADVERTRYESRLMVANHNEWLQETKKSLA